MTIAMTPEEKKRYDEAVLKEAQKMLAAQQKQLNEAYARMMKDGMKGVDKANAALEKERKGLQKELDAARKALAALEKKAEKLFDQEYEKKRTKMIQGAKTELLRDLTWQHIKDGKTTRDIAVWLDVSQKFVEDIRVIVERQKQYATDTPAIPRPDGFPALRYEDNGRGGTIWYESRETTFDMWWEFAGGSALVILDIPTESQWEARTKIPIERRDHILHFIAEQILRDRISTGGHYIIDDNVITFYSGTK